MTRTTMTATDRRRPTFADETAIRAHYQRMLDSWEHGAEAYAECFAPDATYIIANGKVQRGWHEIVDGHTIIFSAWARNSRLEGRIDSINFLTPDVAQLVAYGHIVYKDHRSSEQNKRTVYTITARRGAPSNTHSSHCVQAKLGRALQPRMHRIQVCNRSCHNRTCCSSQDIMLAASRYAVPHPAHSPPDWSLCAAADSRQALERSAAGL